MAMKDKATYTVELDKHMMTFLEEMVRRNTTCQIPRRRCVY